jgi:hypothetical protein
MTNAFVWCMCTNSVVYEQGACSDDGRMLTNSVWFQTRASYPAAVVRLVPEVNDNVYEPLLYVNMWLGPNAYTYIYIYIYIYIYNIYTTLGCIYYRATQTIDPTGPIPGRDPIRT